MITTYSRVIGEREREKKKRERKKERKKERTKHILLRKKIVWSLRIWLLHGLEASSGQAWQRLASQDLQRLSQLRWQRLPPKDTVWELLNSVHEMHHESKGDARSHRRKEATLKKVANDGKRMQTIANIRIEGLVKTG